MNSCKTIVLFAGLTTLVGCAPKLRADTTDQPKAAEATGRHSVVAVDGPTSPLIVDWNPEQRADLEEAIHDGVAIMSYGANGLELLKGCTVEGDYGYLGVTTKTQVVRLESAEDVAINLPLAGAGIAGKIGAEFGQGATLDIALVMIGKRRTTWNGVTRGDLQGGNKCDGATHYVRGITLGAFAMTTGTKQEARAAAEIFGVGASAGSKKAAGVDSSDGKLDACETADPGSEKPPGQCAALLRVELEPITEAAEADEPEAADPTAAPEVEATEVHGCAEGWVFAEGKCTRAKEELAHICKPDDVADCKTQCDKGNAQSCDHYGVLVVRGKASGADAKALFDKGCKGGSASACANLGIRQLGSDRDAGIATLTLACRHGDARSCGLAAHELFPGRPGKRDEKKAFQLYTAGCNGGDFFSCGNLGLMHGGAAKSIPVDHEKAVELHERACNGGLAVSCGNAGLSHEMGMGVPKNATKAAMLFERACARAPGECFRLAILHQHGGGVAQDDGRAKSLYARACKGGIGGLQAMSCFLGQALYEEKAGPVNGAVLAQTLTVMQPQCNSGVVRACSFIGAMALARRDKPTGSMALKRACVEKDAWACDLVKRLKL